MKKTLYRLDSKGKVRALTIYSEGPLVITESGLLDGKKSTTSYEAKPKNIGKKNETTSESQAKLEVSNKLAKKIKDGYFKTVEEAKSTTVVKAMTAKDFEEYKDKITFPCYVQPKLDGVRALTSGGGLVSRKLREFTTMDHITEDIKNLSEVLDGELYIHNMEFNDLSSLIKKVVPGTEKVVYHVYDMYSDKEYSIRHKELSDIVAALNSPNISVVPYIKVNSLEEIYDALEKYEEEGYEGAMARWGDVGYESNSRSKHLLKIKNFEDVACRVLDIIPSEKSPLQGKAVVELPYQIPSDTPNIKFSPNGPTSNFKGVLYSTPTITCSMKMSHSQREELLKNKSEYIGKILEVRYFEKSKYNIPRFPVGYGFRLDK